MVLTIPYGQRAIGTYVAPVNQRWLFGGDVRRGYTAVHDQ